MTETVTIPKAEYDTLLSRIADLEDMTLIAARRHEPSLPLDAVKRLMAGHSAVTLWREERGMTQRALAAAAGISPAMLNEVEKAKRAPSLPTAKAIAEALNVGLDDLF
ncbi:MAG: helix-turn-helix transcriptional regulator [Rhodospirillaceae bacterium]